MTEPKFIPLSFKEYTSEQSLQRAYEFLELCRRRRTVREFSDRPVPREIMEALIMTAGTAPSGANKQPWKFVLVGDPVLKQKIRIAAEEEDKFLARF